MGFVPSLQTKGAIQMSMTDVRSKTEVYVVLRRDDGDESHDRAVEALSILDLLDQHLAEVGNTDTALNEALTQLRDLRETDSGYARYHIQGIAVGKTTEESKQIAVSMCRDHTYLIGPLPVNVALPHGRTEWPGLEFPLRES